MAMKYLVMEGMDQSLDTTSHTLTSLQTLVILLISLEETTEFIILAGLVPYTNYAVSIRAYNYGQQGPDGDKVMQRTSQSGRIYSL